MERRFRVKTNISTVQSKSSFNSSPNTGGEAPDSSFLLSTFRLPPAAQRDHGAENETLPQEQTASAQPRSAERSGPRARARPRAALPPPQAGLWPGCEPLAAPAPSQVPGAGEQSPSCCFWDPDQGQAAPCPVLGAPPATLKGSSTFQHRSAPSLQEPDLFRAPPAEAKLGTKEETQGDEAIAGHVGLLLALH